MFDFLTAIVLVLSGVYEGYRLVSAVNVLNDYSTAMANVGQETAAFAQLQSAQTNAIIEIVICGVLILLTLICLFRFIRYALVRNLSYLLSNTTRGFLKTTNDGSSTMNFTNKDKDYNKKI